jgi:hypothetical protein
MKLNKTCIHNQFYTDFNNLPDIIKDFIIKESSLLIDIENSSYTGYKDLAILRHKVVIDGINYDLEMGFGEICDDNGDNFDNDNEAFNYLEDLLSVTEFDYVPVYLTLK